MKRKAFTLVEMLVTLAVATTLAALLCVAAARALHAARARIAWTNFVHQVRISSAASETNEGTAYVTNTPAAVYRMIFRRDFEPALVSRSDIAQWNKLTRLLATGETHIGQ